MFYILFLTKNQKKSVDFYIYIKVPGKHLTKVEVLQSTWAEAQSIVERDDEIIQ